MRITRVLSIGLALVHLASATDPWDQAKEMLRQAVKRTDPIGESIKGEGSHWEHRDAALYIPMDYYQEEEERRYVLFWNEKSTEWQRTVYNLLVESSNEYDNAEATYALAQLHLWGDYDFPHNKTLAFKYADKFNNLTR